MIVSDGLTWPAIMAQRKSVTRRDWQRKTALRFKRGVVFQSYHNAPFAGGKLIAMCRMTHDAYPEAIGVMPDEDWIAEGFAHLHLNQWKIPEKVMSETWAQDGCSLRAFMRWRKELDDKVVWVARYVIEDVTSEGVAMLKALRRSRNV